MSWTVHDESHGTDDRQLQEFVHRVVDDDDESAVIVSPPKRVGTFTKSSQVFVPPAALTPTDSTTPVKDADYWNRASTPATPAVSLMPSHVATPMSQARPSSATPAKANPIDVTPSRLRFVQSGQIDSIYEQRRQLIMKMEELAQQEMELRGTRSPVTYDVPHAYPLLPSPSHVGYTHPYHNGITADSIRGRVSETAKDQHGCRLLQRALESNDPELLHVIIGEIVPFVAELMTDQYANFLVQKLFDLMPNEVRYNVAQVAAPHMPVIALTAHGTFSVQKLIETIATREEMEVVRQALSRDVVRLVKDVHGNHVIQKLLQRFEHPDKQFIYDAVASDCVGIATNKQGCCVLQRCLEFASPSQQESLVAAILACALQIVQDPFGNYVVQYVLEANDTGVNDKLAQTFLPHLVPLAVNKFSSNVMEKVLRGTSAIIQDAYVDAMKDPTTITRLIQDDYGNYVVQTALSSGSPGAVEGLVATIRPLLHLIRNAPYAKKLEAKMDVSAKKRHARKHNAPQPNTPSPTTAGASYATVADGSFSPTRGPRGGRGDRRGGAPFASPER